MDAYFGIFLHNPSIIICLSKHCILIEVFGEALFSKCHSEELGETKYAVVIETTIPTHQWHNSVIVYGLVVPVIVVGANFFVCGVGVSYPKTGLVQAVTPHHTTDGV